MPLATTRTITSSGRGSQSSTVSMTKGPDFLVTTAAVICMRALWKRLAPSSMRLHLRKHRGARPTIDLEPVAFLISAERSARQHPGFAVDLVVVIAARGENL